MTRAAASTVVVELTPAGRAAVAVVLVDGPAATRAVSECFAPVSGRPFSEVPLGRIALGRWGGAEGEELIACRRAENRVEVHCHGGFAAVARVIGDLVARGCRQISWAEWLHAVPPDSLVAEARIALAAAPTARTAAVLLDQYEGALSRAIHVALQQINAANWSAAAATLDDLLAWQEFGLHLTAPWRVVLAGAPNVGKSSLINALVGYQRAIVSPLPGTTRDVVTLSTAIDGWPVLLADTAGLRESSDELESAGVALAGAALAQADLALAVFDASDDREMSPNMLPQLEKAKRLMQVWNKIDLVEFRRDACCWVSALTGEGISGLAAEISRRLVPDAPSVGTAVPFTLRQFESLSAARAAVDQRDTTTATTALKAMLSPSGAAL